MKQLLAQQEVLFPNLFKNLQAALYPLISKSETGLEKRVVTGMEKAAVTRIEKGEDSCD